jgi:dGTPase
MKDFEYNEESNSKLASYACFSSKSGGRLYQEPEDKRRSKFQRDRDRIIHSTAFRRLEYKTQVFLNNEGDHYRTRLTHSLEVSQLARGIARTLRCDEDLAESIALAHDLGHSPFGHAGEDQLKQSMKEYGGFDHNAQTIRIVTYLEDKYFDYNGLNLSWECLEGLAKHNGPVSKPPRALAEYNKINDLELHTHASIEAQIAAISDDIAYNSHDLEDGLRARLFSLNEVVELPIIGDIIISQKEQGYEERSPAFVNELRSSFIKKMVRNVLENSRLSLEKINPETVDDVRLCGRQIINFSEDFSNDLKIVKKFLFENMYKHHKVLIMTNKAKRIVSDLFNFYIEAPQCLSQDWLTDIDLKDQNKVAIRIADFIAGMTDRYAFKQHKKIFDSSYTML